MNTTDQRTITDEDVNDIWEIAVYGSISYWVGRVDYPMLGETTCRFGGDYLAQGNLVFLMECPDDADPVCHALTRDQLKDGIRKAADHQGLTPRRFLDDADAESADIAVQLAVLGEIRYG